MAFKQPTPASLARDRAWRERGAQAYAARQRDGNAVKQWQRALNTPPPPNRERRRRKPARNDSAWRTECEEAYGSRCVVCGDPSIEMDHIKPRAQGGKSVVENGLPLCGPWSRSVTGGHHDMKTRGELLFSYEWFTVEQLAYLAKIHWVDWDEDGKPFGEGWRHFHERSGS